MDNIDHIAHLQHALKALFPPLMMKRSKQRPLTERRRERRTSLPHQARQGEAKLLEHMREVRAIGAGPERGDRGSEAGVHVETGLKIPHEHELMRILFGNTYSI
jgi:hypothetical protein